MASHSDELVTRINHADINCENFSSYCYVARSEKYLRPLITGIGNYLTRVVGSVPIDLKITLRVTYDRLTLRYRTPSETFGPFYYKGQGTGNV